ncbi:hypothetical protein V6N13_149677 [Hibiscus sabdariffa]
MVKSPHSGWHAKLLIGCGVGSISFHLAGGSVAASRVGGDSEHNGKQFGSLHLCIGFDPGKKEKSLRIRAHAILIAPTSTFLASFALLTKALQSPTLSFTVKRST